MTPSLPSWMRVSKSWRRSDANTVAGGGGGTALVCVALLALFSRDSIVLDLLNVLQYFTLSLSLLRASAWFQSLGRRLNVRDCPLRVRSGLPTYGYFIYLMNNGQQTDDPCGLYMHSY